jgi:hypothetical protein
MDRRKREKRHAVSGPALLRTKNSNEAVAECCNISSTGVLLRSIDLPATESDVWVYFRLGSHKFVAPGEIVRTGKQQVAVVFREQPAGLDEALKSIQQDGRERRTQDRIHLTTLVQVRRQSGEAEVVQPMDVSPGGFGFESVRTYKLGEKVSVSMHYNPNDPDEDDMEWAVVVRTELLPKWDAYSYGVEFLSPER